MLKLLPSLLALLVAVSTAFAAPVQAFVAANPTLSSIVAAVGVIVANFTPRPQLRAPEQK